MTPTMPRAEFRSALRSLGWSHSTAARKLGVSARQRVSDWSRGSRPIPRYIAASVRTHLALMKCESEGDR